MTTGIIEQAPVKKKHSRRWILWLLSVVAAFALGWLLHKCPHKSTMDGGDGVAMSGGPGDGVAGGGKLGAGGGGGGGGGLGGGAPIKQGTGETNKGTPMDGDMLPDPGNGATGDGTDQSKGGGQMPDVTGFGNYVSNLAGSEGASTNPDDAKPPAYETVQKSAKDFSLDHTGLPRYPNQTRVMSGTAVRTDIPGDSSTAAVIESGDSFAKVADWYHAKIPAGWKETRMDDMQKTAQMVSPDAIKKALMAYATGTPATPDSTPAAPPGPAVAIWEAPADGSPVRRSVMVSTLPGKSTVIYLSKAAHDGAHQ